MIVLCVVFHLLWSLVEVQPQPPEPAVTISRSRSGPVYAGTEFVLSTTISFGDLSGFDMEYISSLVLDIRWSRGDDDIVNDTRTTVSPVSGSGQNYTASLTYSPINCSDSGKVTATVNVTAPTTFGVVPTTVSSTEMLNVKGTCNLHDLRWVDYCDLNLKVPLHMQYFMIP